MEVGGVGPGADAAIGYVCMVVDDEGCEVGAKVVEIEEARWTAWL